MKAAVEKGGGLVIPSRPVVSMVKVMEAVFYANVGALISGDNLAAQLHQRIVEKTSATDLQLHSTNHEQRMLEAIVQCYLRVRIFHWCKTLQRKEERRRREKRSAGQKRRGVTVKPTAQDRKLRRLNAAD